MDIDLENCLIEHIVNYLVIYIFVLLCDTFRHIDFESDLNSCLEVSMHLMRTSEIHLMVLKITNDSCHYKFGQDFTCICGTEHLNMTIPKVDGI